MDFESLARELSEAAKPTTKIDGRHTAQLLASARCLVKKLESPDDVVPPLAKMVTLLTVQTSCRKEDET